MTQQKSTRIPDTGQLLEAVAGYLEAELLPSLDGRQRFNTRVSINVLRIVQRELAQPLDAETQADLRKHLGVQDAEPEALLLALAEGIRRGELNTEDKKLLKLLRRITLQRLAVDNPRYSSYLAALNTEDVK